MKVIIIRRKGTLINTSRCYLKYENDKAKVMDVTDNVENICKISIAVTKVG